MVIAVIADTHMPRGGRRLPDACVERIEAADLLLHAGDLMTVEVLRELEAIGPPLAAVHGNMDTAELRRLLPAERVVEAGGARIAMVHDAGPRRGRLERMRRRFERPGRRGGVRPLPPASASSGPATASRSSIPGSPTERRRAPRTRWGWPVPRPGSSSSSWSS